MPIRSGDVIDGKYRLERTLGIGGMGIVYEAHHIELEVRRAIKIMQPPTGNDTGTDNVDPSAQVRFLREARAAARIVSEHVAHVYDVGVLESGERYMVIEYLSGTDLERLVRKRGPLSADKAVAYVLQACSGISEAHKLGIIHRDIKSSNLFLTESEVIKVIDWGLAKQTLNGETGITQANHVVGSLAYMSPEQLNGDEVDARTDIWSLGVVLHELVTGKLPFTGGTCGEIIHHILRHEPLAMPWIAGVWPAIAAILGRCLQKDRSLRYASVGALASDLRSIAGSRCSAPDTRETTTDGTPPDVSLIDTAASERRSNQHEQETAVQRHHRDRSTGSSQPAVRESKPTTETKTLNRDRRTPGSRAALYMLAAVVLLVRLLHAIPVPERPPPSSKQAAAIGETRRSEDGDRMTPQVLGPAKPIEHASPDLSPPAPQPRVLDGQLMPTPSPPHRENAISSVPPSPLRHEKKPPAPPADTHERERPSTGTTSPPSSNSGDDEADDSPHHGSRYTGPMFGHS